MSVICFPSTNIGSPYCIVLSFFKSCIASIISVHKGSGILFSLPVLGLTIFILFPSASFKDVNPKLSALFVKAVPLPGPKNASLGSKGSTCTLRLSIKGFMSFELLILSVLSNSKPASILSLPLYIVLN